MDDVVSSGLFVSATSTGQAGDLIVATPNLTISDGAAISAQSTLTTGGNIFINADHTLLRNDGAISSTVFGKMDSSDGGNVAVNSDTLVLLDSALPSGGITARAEQGLGGNITVNARALAATSR